MFAFCLIPFLALFFLFLACYNGNYSLSISNNIRYAALVSTLMLGVIIVAITETLSYFKQIAFVPLLITWIIILLIAVLFAVRRKKISETNKILAYIYRFILKSWTAKIILGVLLVSFVVAILYPTNNYDSLTYHMARVAHWQQAQSISHYQTHVTRQLVFPPLAEWIILHLDILSGSDRLANAVQLFFFAGCILMVSLITAEFGGNSRQQKISAILACFIPEAIIQSNTTQNDVVVAYFILAFVFFAIKILQQQSPKYIVLAGVSFGLALLTKGTANIFACMFCLWMAFLVIREYRQPLIVILKKALLIALIPLIAFAINYGHFYRNAFLTGSILGNASQGAANEGFGAKDIAGVTVRNFLNHMPVTREIKLQLIDKSFKLGVNLDDPRYSFMPTSWMAEGFIFHEDYMQNFMHMLLIAVFAVVFFFRRSFYTQRLSLYNLYVLSVFGTFILFSVLLKWQPWSNRLETAMFMMACVFLAIEMGSLKKWFRLAIILPTIGFGLAALLLSERHPILPVTKSILKHDYNYFLYEKGFLDCKNYIDSTNYRTIGIQIGSDNHDYQYYKLLSKKGNEKRIIKHVFVQNESTMYLDDFNPDVILSLSSAEQLELNGRVYYRTRIFEKATSVFEPK